MSSAFGTDPVRVTVPRRLSTLDGLRGEVPPVAHVAGVCPDREPTWLASLGGLLVDVEEGFAGCSLVAIERLVTSPHVSIFPLACRGRVVFAEPIAAK